MSLVIKMICATTSKGYIGKDNKLLFNLKKDMQHFKEKTLNSIVVMGKNTYESLPMSVLPKRVNVILTSDRDYPVPQGGFIAHSKEQILNNYNSGAQTKDVFIIGGSYLYRQFLDDVSMIYLTRIKNDETVGDVSFPLSKMQDKFICMKYESYIEDGVEFTIEEWIKEDYKEEYYKLNN